MNQLPKNSRKNDFGQGVWGQHASTSSLQNFRHKMRGASVYIVRGDYAGKHGTIRSAQFDHRIQDTTYTVFIPGNGPQHPLDYIHEEIPDETVIFAARDCAVYHPVGSRVRVLTGGYSGYYGHVTACKYNETERFYEIRICFPAEQFPAYATDYLPCDIHETFPANMLGPY